ncbi:MAG: prolipoprotein diacylglyceryl transferase [Bacteroidales bacterium]|nr:prolipoprotein diacylglyceryl transferase [Bacteroidales bacterium]
MLSYITWTARPDLFILGNWEVRWYGMFFAIGFYVGLLMISKIFAAEKVKESWADSLFIYVILATIFGARLGHVFFYAWDYYSIHPWDIIKIWEGGLASHGGAIGILIAIWLYSRQVTKRNILWTLDRLMIPTALVAAMIRMGNLMNHEIYGVSTDLPWAFRFIENVRQWQHGASPIFSAPSHPTQIYEALCYLGTFVLLYTLYWKKTKTRNQEGLLLGIFFFCMFLSRFMIEFVKEDQEAFEANMTLNMGQWLSIPFILAGIFLIIRAFRRAPVYYKTEETKKTEKAVEKNFSGKVTGKTKK